MFNCRSDDMPAVRPCSVTNTANRQVVRLSTSGGKDDLDCASVDERSNLPPCFIDGGPRFLSELMNTRSVAEFLFQERHHRIDYPRVDGRGGAVIEINSRHK